MVHLSISHPAPPPLLILLSGSDTFVLGFVCLPERLADKIWLDVAWSEDVGKKERGCPGRRGATKLNMQGKPKEELSSLRVVGLQGHNSMSTGFWNSMGVGGEEGCLED